MNPRYGAVLLCVALAGCGSPTTPTRPPSGVNQILPAGVPLSVSGTIQDDSGRPVGLASVVAFLGSVAVTCVDADGRYACPATAVSDAGVLVTVSAMRLGYDRGTASQEFTPGQTTSLSIPVTLKSVTDPIDPGQSVSNTIEAGLPYNYLGEAYESDYTSAYRAFRLSAAATTDTSIELRWSGAQSLALWLVDGLTVTAAAGGSGSAGVVIPAGQEPLIVVGATRPVAPETPIPFTLMVSARPS